MFTNFFGDFADNYYLDAFPQLDYLQNGKIMI